MLLYDGPKFTMQFASRETLRHVNVIAGNFVSNCDSRESMINQREMQPDCAEESKRELISSIFGDSSGRIRHYWKIAVIMINGDLAHVL